MSVPRTYRYRLITYVILLLAFLLGVLMFSYISSRAVILQEAENNIYRITQQIRGQLAREAVGLQEQARMIRDDVQLQEYIFVVQTLKTGTSPLQALFERQFGWLPVAKAVLLTADGTAMFGGTHEKMIGEVLARHGQLDDKKGHVFTYNEDGLGMVAAAPVSYRGQALGYVAISRLIDEAWLRTNSDQTDGQLFVVKGGKIALSSLGREWNGAAFGPRSGELDLGGEAYLARSIALPDAAADAPSLWLALSKAELTARLNQLLTITITLVVVGSLGILVVGAIMLRNFSAPLSRLVDMIKDVGEGRFPAMHDVDVKDEVAYATNKFYHMVAALQEKQAEIDQAHAELEKQAITDVLTGLYNRRQLFELFPKLLSEVHRQGNTLAVIIADLDRFKEINDRHGHLAGDRCLCHFAEILRKHCRESDFVFRLGGEEFLVLNIGTAAGGKMLAEKIRTALEDAPLQYDKHVIYLRCSFGVTQTNTVEGGNSLEIVLNQADKALYAAKRSGRNRVMVWEKEQLSA